MLFVLFRIGKDRYALEASRVVELIPLLPCASIPGAPRGVAGMINYRGRLVPAIDLSLLATGAPAPRLLSTRLILLRHPDSAGRPHLLAVIAEQATEVVRCDPRHFEDSGVKTNAAQFPGPVLMDPKGPIQWLRQPGLLAEPMRDFLFSPASTATTRSHSPHLG